MLPGVVGDHPAAAALVPFTLAELGRRPEADDAFQRLADDGFVSLLAADPVAVLRTMTLALLSEVAGFLGDERGAARLLELLNPLAGRTAVVHPGVAVLAPVDHLIGTLEATLGRWERSVPALESALTFCRRTGSGALEARTLAALARAHRGRGTPAGHAEAGRLEEEARARAGQAGVVLPEWLLPSGP
jgi:hypothetical protein